MRSDGYGRESHLAAKPTGTESKTSPTYLRETSQFVPNYRSITSAAFFAPDGNSKGCKKM
jgi:hypothetical protein